MLISNVPDTVLNRLPRKNSVKHCGTHLTDKEKRYRTVVMYVDLGWAPPGFKYPTLLFTNWVTLGQ